MTVQFDQAGSWAAVPGRLIRLDRLLDRLQRLRFGQLLVVIIQRIAAGDQPVPGPGRTVAERAADPFPLQLAALQYIGRQLGVRQHHPPDADQVDPAGTHDGLGHVRQIVLQVRVACADHRQSGKRLLARPRGVNLASDAGQRIFGWLVAVARREERRPLEVRVVVGAAGAHAGPADAEVAQDPQELPALLERLVDPLLAEEAERRRVALVAGLEIRQAAARAVDAHVESRNADPLPDLIEGASRGKYRKRIGERDLAGQREAQRAGKRLERLLQRFADAGPLADPFVECGIDSTEDSLPCRSFRPCAG